jgi:hypothetical protein
VEIDIWVPEYKLGFEYQGMISLILSSFFISILFAFYSHFNRISSSGEHHYHDMSTTYGPYGALPLYMQRDGEKKTLCERAGITYIPV